MIVGVFTGLCESGGIQRVSRHIGAVLTELARDHDEPCVLVSLTDPAGLGTFRVGKERYPFQGHARNRLSLARSFLSLASQIRVGFFGHVNLGPLGLLLKMYNRRARYWVAVHGIEVWEPLPWTRRIALRKANGVASVSTFTAERMVLTQRVDPNNVCVLPVAVDPDFCETSGKTTPGNTRDDIPLILSVGRLISGEPGKGIDHVISALPAVLRVVPKVSYVVVGDGDDRPRLESLARDHHVAEHVCFVGELTSEDLRQYYSRANLFVMPSRQEGLGIVFLEAMAHGKPVIGVKHGGTPEIISDGITGYLVEYGDVELLAERITRILSDAPLANAMGQEARRWVLQSRSFTRFRESLAALVDGT